MDRNECKDRLFDILNETDALPVYDLVVDDEKDIIHVYLDEGTTFSIHMRDYGRWGLFLAEKKRRRRENKNN